MSKEKVEIELTAKGAQLKSEFDQARAKVQRFEAGVKKAVLSVAGLAVGVLGLRAGIAVFGEISEKFDRFGKLANRFDTSVEEIQKLGLAASLSGASLEKLASATVRAKVAGIDAAKGLSTQADAFADLGIEVGAFNAAGPTQQVEMLADAYVGATDKAAAMHAGTKIMGKGFTELVPLLNEGGEGIRNLTKDLVLLDAADVKAIETFNDDLELLKTNMQAQIAKQFAGDLKELQPSIVAVGTALVNGTSFLVKHHRAIGLMIGAWGAYKGIGIAAEMGKTIAALVGTGLALVTTKAATDAETAAVTRNTAAQIANAIARNTASGAAVKGALAGRLMGGAAAANFGVGFLAKFSPHVIAAAVGFGIGKTAGDAAADKMQNSFEEAFRKANGPLDQTLATVHELVTTAETVKQTTAARARIHEEIVALERQNIRLAKGMKKEAVEHVIAVLKQRYVSADTVRLRNQALIVEKDITSEQESQSRSQQFWNDLNEKALVIAQQKAEAAAQASHELRETIRALKGDITAEQVDMLPPESRVKYFSEQLKQGMKSAVGEFNLSSRASGKAGGANKADESLKGLYALAQRAEKEGNDGLAKSIYEQIKTLQKVQAEITKAKGETSDKALTASQKELDQATERADKEKKIADIKASQTAKKGELGAEMLILRLEASGQLKKAAALQKEIRLRKEAHEIAAETGVTEEEALRLARQRESLRARVDGMKSTSRTDSSEEGRSGKKRIRLYNLQESLQRRLARQSPTDRKSNISRADRMGLGERFVREAEASRQGPGTAIVKGNDDVPGKLDQMIGLNERLVSAFENIVTV